MAILGIDEVGRGPWAGPLVIGACILPPHDNLNTPWISQLTDSKKLTAKKRTELSDIIRQNAIAHGLGWVPSAELDEIGLSASLHLAAKRAVDNLLHNYTVRTNTDQNYSDLPFDEIIIDGTQNFLKNTQYGDMVTVLKKADFLIKEVSAASILAKVARDNYMIELAKQYPEYFFERHMGYGTAKHQQALREYGPCPEHRRSFKPVAEIVRNHSAVSNQSYNRRHLKNTTEIGAQAENIVAAHLESLGHTIMARNYKTKSYEIDIISATSDCIYFTEVRYRRSSNCGSPLESIDIKKQQQMKFAGEAFLGCLSRKLGRELPPSKLAVASVTGEDFVLREWFPLVD